MRLYFDSSALVKLVQAEAESEALEHFISRQSADELTSCSLARVEVIRAVFAGGAEAVAHADRHLARFELLALSDELLERAALVAPGMGVRSLGAIHLAAAATAGAELRAIVTYDRRMADAATALDLTVASPGG